MKPAIPTQPADQPTVLIASLAILGISLFVQQSVAGLQYLSFLIGVGLGITLMHAAFGFTGSWRAFIRERNGKGIRAQLMLLGLTSLLFFPVLGQIFPSVQAGAALAPVGTSVLVGAFLFGIGMQLGGGCGSGTLYTMGQGQVDMLITLAFFIVGATLGTVHLDWWLSLPGYGNISVIAHFGWVQALLLQLVILAALYGLVRLLEIRRYGKIKPVEWQIPQHEFTQRFIHGQWPLWWGVVGLTLLNLATLIVADLRATLIDLVFLPDVHPTVADAMVSSDIAASTDADAIGLIETRTIASGVDAADAAVKAADVALSSLRMADGIDGKAYFIVEGVIGEVEAAVEAGETRAADQLVASVVIAQLTDELRADLAASAGFLERVRAHRGKT